MRRCIVHIGVPKTGSTALQRTLNRNASALEEAGILYRTTADGANGAAKHQRLAMELLRDRNSERLGLERFQLGELLTGTAADTVVLSSEAFSDPKMDHARIADFLAFIRAHDFEPTAVVYVRAQPSLANSSYSQKVKTFNYSDPFNDFLDVQLASKNWRYSQRLAPWINQMRLNLVVAPFTQENIGPDIAAKMLKMAGVPADQVDAAAMAPAPQVNETPGPMAVAGFRLLMRMRPRGRKEWRSSSASNMAIKEAKRRGWYEERFVGLDGAALSRIEEACEQDNEGFANRFLGRPWRDVFAADYGRTWEANEIDLDRMEPQVSSELESFVHGHIDSPKVPAAERAKQRANKALKRSAGG